MLFLQTVSDLPLEMLETILINAFMMLYLSDCKSDKRLYMALADKSRNAQRRPFTLLASVCVNWHQALVGWPQSSTPRWLRHKLKKLIKC